MARTDGFRKITLFSVTDELGSLGTNTNCGSYWGTLFGVTDRDHDNLFMRVDY